MRIGNERLYLKYIKITGISSMLIGDLMNGVLLSKFLITRGNGGRFVPTVAVFLTIYI